MILIQNSLKNFNLAETISVSASYSLIPSAESHVFLLRDEFQKSIYNLWVEMFSGLLLDIFQSLIF